MTDIAKQPSREVHPPALNTPHAPVVRGLDSQRGARGERRDDETIELMYNLASEELASQRALIDSLTSRAQNIVGVAVVILGLVCGAKASGT